MPAPFSQMPIETEADRLGLIEDEAEDFDTGKATSLRAVFRRRREDVFAGDQVVPRYHTELYCSAAAAAEHELVIESPIRRIADDDRFFVKDLDPDGTGMIVIELKR